MTAFFKYLGAFCLISIALSLALATYTAYQSLQMFNRMLAGADSYTCKQFLYDMQQPAAEKLPAMMIAVAAYGTSEEHESLSAYRDEVTHQGILPAVKKVADLCRNKPPLTQVLALYAATIVPPAEAAPASSLVSPSVITPAEASTPTNPISQ